MCGAITVEELVLKKKISPVPLRLLQKLMNCKNFRFVITVIRICDNYA